MDVTGRAQFPPSLGHSPLSWCRGDRKLPGNLCLHLLSASFIPGTLLQPGIATPDSQRAELSLREGRRVQITKERLSRCVGGGGEQQYQSRKVGRTVRPWGADGHEERAPTALQTTLDSEGPGSVSSIDVPAEEQLTAAPAALRCLETPPSFTVS